MKFEIKDMLKREVYDHPVQNITLMETHISWIVLTGEYAYKIKKLVNFGFLDFSTLEKRLIFCKKELKLNRRLTTGIYIDVVVISENKNKLHIGGSVVIEYAIKMKQFPQSAQMDNMLVAGELSINHIDECARMIADFHRRTDIIDEESVFGSTDTIRQYIEENFTHIKQHLKSSNIEQTLSSIKKSCIKDFERLKDVFITRKQLGFIRDCHGGMHLRNMVWLAKSFNI